MKIGGKTIRTTCFTKYCKSKLGYAAKKDVKLYDLVCMALELDGMPVPMNITSSAWVKENIDHIVGDKKIRAVRAAKIKKKPVVFNQSDSFIISNDFLFSFEWRKLRMQAIKLHGARCMCCGATPATGAVINVDHVKPRKKYPQLALEITNLQILCHVCNHGKGNWDETDWRKS